MVVIPWYFAICDPGPQNQSYGSIFKKLRFIHHMKAE